MINVVLTGDRELMARIERMPAAVREMLRRKLTALSLRLRSKIQREKLSGQVLNVVTGALRRSIMSRVFETSTAVIGEVYSSGDVKYARIHEYGGKTRAHIIRPRKAEALHFMMGSQEVFAKYVNHPGSTIPERSYMRSSLGEMASEIKLGMKRAVIDGLIAAQEGRA